MSRRSRKSRKSGKFRVNAFSVVLLLPLAAIVAWLYFPRSVPQLSTILEQMGYNELAPPSRLFPPGTISTVETLSNGSRRLHLACTINEDALEPFLVKSSTVDRSRKWQIENAFKASAQALSAAVSSATGNQVKKLDIALQNMSVVTMSHENMIRVRRTYLKDDCEQAVLWNLRAGADVCQVGEVLQADVAYRLFGVEGIDVNQKLELTEKVKAQIEHPVVTTDNDEIRGKGLYLGVRVNLYCFRLKDDHRIVGTITSAT